MWAVGHVVHEEVGGGWYGLCTNGFLSGAWGMSLEVSNEGECRFRVQFLDRVEGFIKFSYYGGLGGVLDIVDVTEGDEG